MAEQFIQDIVENPHPVYSKYVHYWNFLIDSYEGGVDYTSADVPQDLQSSRSSDEIQVMVDGQKHISNNSLYLFRHQFEKDKSFNRRVLRSYYYNFCAPIIDIYTDHLFRNPITEDFKSLETYIDKRGNNIDRKGSSLIEFRKESAEMSQIYGHYYATVDMPQDKGEVNLQQKIENDKFAFFTQYAPQNLINWSLDSSGRPFWVVLRETADDLEDITQFTKEKGNKINYNYRAWTRSEWAVYDKEYKLLNNGTHQLKQVPLVTFYNKMSKKYRGFMGISELADISFIMRDVYNLCSELSQIITDQTFAFLAIQGTIQDYGGDQSLGTGKGLLYPEGANLPAYVSPSADNARVIMDQIDRQINKAFQLAKLEGGSADQKNQIKDQSGISKAFDFHQTNSSLNKKASNLNDSELKLFDLVSKWESGKEFDGAIVYPDNFSVTEVNNDIKEAQEILKLNVGKLTHIAMNKAIMKKKFPRMSEEDMDELIEDMESTVNKESDSDTNNNGNRLRDRLNLSRVNTNNPVGDAN